jgi:GH15 family glucan-1,4-alpha-glucosidase
VTVPIEDHAVIGNKRTAALVAADGTIDWYCPQAFDAPSVFAALLDDERGGAFTLAPSDPSTVARRYLPDTNVLETTFTTAGGVVRVTDAMALPSTGPLDYNQIVRRVDGLDGRVALRWSVAPRFGYGRREGAAAACRDAVVIADGDLTLAVQAFGAGTAEVGSGGARGAFTCAEGDVAVLALSSFDIGPIALPGADELLARLDGTADHWRRWTTQLRADGPWRDALLRSALALDLMVDDETGAIVAAPTLGLPERPGGDRNYDYRYSWLRDTNLTLEAMLRLGLTEQVHASLRWTFEAIGHAHPRLRPMHRVDGRATLPEGELDLAGYAGSRPVRVGNTAESQLQLGSYGDVFDMVYKYVRAGNALTGAASTRLAELADFVCLVWDRPDSGLWELPETAHYTQSKVACHLALRRATTLARDGHLPGDRAARWSAAAEAIRRFVHERCWSARRRAYTRAADSDELDAGVLLGARGGLLGDEPDRLASTVEAVFDRLGAGGPLLYRFETMRGREGAFLACSFWAAEALACCGRSTEAGELIGALVARGNDVGLFSEQIDPDGGGFLGNMPQALSHLTLVNAVGAHADAIPASDTEDR